MSASTTPSTTPTTTVAAAITNATGGSFPAAVASLKRNLSNAAALGASDVPDAVHEIAQLSPSYADKSLAASKTLYGIIAVQALTAVVHHFNLGWAPDVIAEIAGGCILIGIRIITSAPITSVWPKGEV